MNVAMEKTSVGPGMSRQPYDAPTSPHKMIVALAAPAGTAANNRRSGIFPRWSWGKTPSRAETLCAKGDSFYDCNKNDWRLN